MKPDPKYSPRGPLELIFDHSHVDLYDDSNSDDELNSDWNTDSESDDETNMDSDYCTLRDVMQDTMFACMACTNVVQVNEFEGNLQSVCKDRNFCLDNKEALIEGKLSASSAFIEETSNDDYSLNSNIFEQEKTYEIDVLAKHMKSLDLVACNEHEEEHEVIMEELINDADVLVSANKNGILIYQHLGDVNEPFVGNNQLDAIINRNVDEINPSPIKIGDEGLASVKKNGNLIYRLRRKIHRE